MYLNILIQSIFTLSGSALTYALLPGVSTRTHFFPIASAIFLLLLAICKLHFRDNLRKPFHPKNVVSRGVLLFLPFVGQSAGYGQALVVTPNPASVRQGESLTFKSNQPVAWSLANGSSGNLIVNSTTSATYTAPNVILPQGVSAGCQTTPSDSVFNTRIDNLPVEANSASWIAIMNPKALSVQPDFGTNVVDASTTMVNEAFLYTPANNGTFPLAAAETGKRQTGTYQTDLSSGSTDRHAMYVDPRSCSFYEVYKHHFTPQLCGTKTCTATSGVSYPWSSYTLPTLTTQASNLIFHPLLIRLAELKAGAINHALSFTESQYSLHALSYWPANSVLGCKSCGNGPPYGARFRLKPSFDISTFSPNAQVILRALQQYGMFLTDASVGGAVLYADTDVTQDPTVVKAFAEIATANITMTSFDAVDESSFIVNTKSMQVNPANGYQTPANYAVLNLTPASGTPLSIPIALGSQAPGVPSPTLFIIAGTPSYSLRSWVGGGSSAPLTWSLLSGTGSVTPDGFYTPPTSVAAPTAAVLQVAANANPALSTRVNVTVLPSGTNPTGSIRIDVGSTVSTKSSGNTKTWLADIAYEGGLDKLINDYPKWLNQTDPDANVYQSFHYTSGNDLTYSLGVPNGNYKVRMMFGAPYNGKRCTAPCSYDVLTYPTNWGPYNLIANGQVAAHNYDFGVSTVHTNAMPVDTYIPAWVTNNQLTISVRGYRPDSMPGYSLIMPVLEGIEILPDNASPHLSIDSQQQTSVPAGTSLQLYSVGWYMNNSAIWAIVSGEGSIDQRGVYTAPAIAPTAPQPVVIRATSPTNWNSSATIQLTVPAAN